MRKYYLYFGFICLFCLLLSSACKAPTDTKMAGSKAIGKELSIFEDSSLKLELKDIQQLDKFQFKQYNHDVFVIPTNTANHWLYYRPTAPVNNDDVLELMLGNTWHFDIYEKKAGQNEFTLLKQTGSLSAGFREEALFPIVYLPLHKDSLGTPSEYLFKVRSGLPMELSIHRGSKSFFAKKEEMSFRFLSLFEGGMLALFLYNLFILFAFRNKVYALYLGYLVSMFFTVTFVNNQPVIIWLLGDYFPEGFFFRYTQLWSNPFLFFFFGAFCIDYLDLKKELSAFATAIEYEMWIFCVILPIFSIFDSTATIGLKISQFFLLFFSGTCFLASIIQLFKGNRNAKFYSISWSFVFLAFLLFFFAANGFLIDPLYAQAFIYIGIASEVSLFSLGLADKFNQLKKKAKELEHQALSKSKENEEILLRKKQYFEHTVEEKTKELVAASNEFSHSINEIYKSKEALKSESQSKDRLFNMISHDLRSPLFSLQLLIGQLRNGSIDKDEFKLLLKEMAATTNQVGFTLENMLQWAKTQLNKLNLNPKKTTALEVLNAAQSYCTEFSDEKNIQLIIKPFADFPLFIDSDKMQLVLRNLIHNAIKFSHPGQSVWIWAEKSDSNALHFCVQDEGLGIEHEMDLNQLSIKSSKLGTEGENGAGIGLILCKELMQFQGGFLHLHRQEKGLLVKAILPLEQVA